jgi:hypothetical protein
MGNTVTQDEYFKNRQDAVRRSRELQEHNDGEFSMEKLLNPLGETHVVVPISLMQQISKVLTDYAEDAEEYGQLNAIVTEIESLLAARPK